MRTLRTILVTALLLVAVTAGSATAGALIGSARIKDDTVSGADIRNGTLTGADVRDASLQLTDLTDLEPGVQGPQGPVGAPGANGVPGLVYRNTPLAIPRKEQLTWSAECADGEKAVSGGVSSASADLAVRRSFPNGDDWGVEVLNSGEQQTTVYAWALCIPN
ncbi:uncharacterized protein YjbI with pentapeptide repeats [Nocardioides thalensis]|uniref:Uncharacterized protein YjbI with pentapeptide repeats n=1 Tax=Nocardioides thalensis TaxID=1914755 RepID=A0A853C4M7_9ACTN|nr:hypothetical protein [Nocardioides thalensis]NYJ02187.1 uncharacterized protein YjbI with pentapeptide repeats [Nocardioides thalensis]